jgi:hypothetical protein
MPPNFEFLLRGLDFEFFAGGGVRFTKEKLKIIYKKQEGALLSKTPSKILKFILNPKSKIRLPKSIIITQLLLRKVPVP